MFQPEKADFTCQFLECLQCSNGQPFQLMDWQKKVVSAFYGEMVQREDIPYPIRQYQYLYLEIPKKNGKSELAGGLGVYHLFADGETNGEVYLVAADRDNASIVYNVAKWMVEHSPALKQRARIVDSMKTIFDTVSGSKLKVLSSEAYSKHGYKPSCVIFDELHAQKNRDLWDVMTFGAGDAREQPVWIVLTTAGDDPDRKSIGWEIHEKALSILRCRNGKGNEKDVDDPRWLPVVYGLGQYADEDLPTLNIYEEALWKQCNPSVGKTVKLSTIRAEAQDARNSEAAERLFRWLRLNQWIAVHSVNWIPLPLYDRTEWRPSSCNNWTEVAKQLKGKKCFGGVDLSKSTDMTAFALVFPPQDELDHWVALVTGWIPTTDLQEREKRDHALYYKWMKHGFIHGCEGEIINFDDIFATILDAANIYDLQMVGFDPWLGSTLIQRLQNALTETATQVVAIPQGIRNISAPMKELERLIRAQEMFHVENPALRWCFGNVKCTIDDNENIKPSKKHSTGRIDMTVAWIIAFATALLEQPNLSNAIADGSWTL